MRKSCKCYNIKVEITKELNSAEVPHQEQEELSENFFDKKKFFKITPGGCQEMLLCLISSKLVGTWNIRKCLVCRIFTHAINIKTGEKICNTDLIDDIYAESSDDSLPLPETFSDIFQVVLPPDLKYDHSCQNVDNANLSISQQESIAQIRYQEKLYTDKQRQKRSLNKDESFTEEIFNSNLEKAKLHANILVQIVVKSQDSFGSPVKSLIRSGSLSKSSSSASPKDKSKKRAQKSESSFSEEAMFRMDEDEICDSSPDLSDIEVPDPDEESTPHVGSMAQSVPVNVPIQKDEDKKVSCDDESSSTTSDIGGAIRNLAKSYREGADKVPMGRPPTNS